MARTNWLTGDIVHNTDLNALGVEVNAKAAGSANVYHTNDHGLVGNWSGGDADAGSGTNDTAALNTLIAAAPAGSIIVFDGSKTYRLDPLTTITKALTFDFNGASVVTRTTDSGDLSFGTPFIHFRSTVGTARAINAAAINAASVTTSTAGTSADFSVGDAVLIYDSKTIVKWDTGANAAGDGRGEVNTVKAVDTGTGVVTLDVPLSFDPATTPRIQLITSPIVSAAVKNVGLLIDTNPGGIINGGVLTPGLSLPHIFYFENCVDPKIENVKVDGWEIQIAAFQRCLRPRAVDVQGRNPFQTSAGHGYIGRMYQCVDGEFHRCVGHAARHVADYVGGARCGSRECKSYNNVAAAFITHGIESRDIYSVDDVVVGGSSYGWSHGNTQYNSDFGYTVVRPTYIGLNRALLATGNSEGLRLIAPNFHAYNVVIKIENNADNVVLDLTGGVVENFDSTGSAIWATGTNVPTDYPANVTILGDASCLVGAAAGINLNISGKATIRGIPNTRITIGAAGSTEITPSDVASQSGTETFTNKTLTAPRINSISDTNGNTILDLPPTASAVNRLSLSNAAAGGNPLLNAIGSDTNISPTLRPKGTGLWGIQDPNVTTKIVRLDPSSVVGTRTWAFPNAASTFVGTDASQTLTSKTIDADSNTLSNIEVDNFKGSAIVTAAEGVTSSDNDTSIPTTAAVIDAIAAGGGGGGVGEAGKLFAPAAYVTGNYYFCNSVTASATFGTLGNSNLRVSPWLVNDSITVVSLFAEFTVAGEASSKFRIGIFNDDGFGRPGTLVLDAGAISTGSGNAGDVATGGTAGVYEITVSQALTAGLYWVGGVVQGAATTQPTMRIISDRAPFPNGPLGTSLPAAGTLVLGFSKTSVSGALSNITSPVTATTAPRIGFKVA